MMLGMSQEIRFLYANPLDIVRRELAVSRNIAYPSVEEVRTQIQEWKRVWDEVNRDEQILTRLSELTKAVLSYPLEANCIGGMFDTTSVPFILVTHKNGAPISKEEFIHTCIHEVAHRFIGQNEGTQSYLTLMTEAYPLEPAVTRGHILIYALLSGIVPAFCGAAAWEDCLKVPNPDYQRALALMQERGAEKCIEEFQRSVAR